MKEGLTRQIRFRVDAGSYEKLRRDAGRQALSLEIVTANSMRSSDALTSIFDHVAAWEDASTEERERVVDVFIDKITIADGKMDIFWNI